jgi:hypothetical protein
MRNKFMPLKCVFVVLLSAVLLVIMGFSTDLDTLPEAIVSRLDALGKYNVSDNLAGALRNDQGGMPYHLGEALW